MVPHPVDDGFCIVQAARQNEVTDDDALLQEAVIVQFVRANLVVHMKDGFRCDLGIIFSRTVALSQGRIEVFQIGQINLDLALESVDGRCRFIAAAVVDNRHGQGLCQTFEDGLLVRRRRDEVDVMGALFDELAVDIPQARRRNRHARTTH